MKSSEISTKKDSIIERRKELTAQLDGVKAELTQLQTECPHELVLVFDDHCPHMIGPTHRCKCPACGKREDIYPTHEYEKSSFKDSKRINLTDYDFCNLGFTNCNEIYTPIITEIFTHYEYYYESGTPIEEINQTMRRVVDAMIKVHVPVKQIGKNPFLFKSND